MNNKNNEYRPGGKILIYEDRSRKLTLNDVQQLEFKPNNKLTINAGSTASALWCIMKVRNETGEDWYIEMGEPYIDYIDLYSIDSLGVTSLIKTGLRRRYDQRSIRVNHFIVPLNVGFNEEKTYYIRAQSYTILKLPMVISTIQNHFEINHRADLTNGIYFGLILALSLYNLFVYLLLKDKTYLYYVFYINFLGATISWLRGYSPEFLSIIPPNIIHGNNFAAITYIFLVLFTHSFLNLSKTAPIHKWVKLFFFIVSLVAIITTVTGKYYFSFIIIMFLIAVNLPYIAVFGIYALKKGFKPAGFYLLGFTFFTLGDLLFIISENANIGQSVFSGYSLQIGSSIEAIILSFALANKLNVYKREKEEAQAKALTQANEFAGKLIRTQEDERKRIAGELHDSVGQSLSLIKNRIALLKKANHQPQSLDELNVVVTNTIQEIRSITYGLRPFQLDILGLTQSIKSLTEDVAESGEITFHTKIDNIDNYFSKDAEINVFRIVQECLSNISRHSQATEARVEIRNPGDKVEIIIEDNGIGLDRKINGHGFGMIGITERAHLLKGDLQITANSPSGTRIRVLFT